MLRRGRISQLALDSCSLHYVNLLVSCLVICLVRSMNLMYIFTYVVGVFTCPGLTVWEGAVRYATLAVPFVIY